MPDEMDAAQEAVDEHIQYSLASRKQQPRVLRLCEECEENHVFLTPQGTMTRICKVCLAKSAIEREEEKRKNESR